MTEFKFIKPAKARPFEDKRDKWILSLANTTTDYYKHKIIGEIKRNGWRFYCANDKQYTATGHIHRFEKFKHPLDGYVFDGEIAFSDLRKQSGDVTTALADGNYTDLFFYAFDIVGHPCFSQEELLAFPLEKRKRLLKSVIEELNHPKYVYNPVYYGDFGKIIESLLEDGGEGMVFKYLDKPYKAGSRANMIKYKFFDDYDVVIVDAEGYPSEWTVRPGEKGRDGILYPDGKHTEPWLRGYRNLRYGLYDSKTKELKVLGSFGFTGPKEKISKHIGKVAIVKAYSQFPSGCLQHPIFQGWRHPEDKSAEMCLFDFEKGVQV